jgi:hypothetical protein
MSDRSEREKLKGDEGNIEKEGNREGIDSF